MRSHSSLREAWRSRWRLAFGTCSWPAWRCWRMPVFFHWFFRLHRSPHGRPLVRSVAGNHAGPRRLSGSSFSCIPACCWAFPGCGPCPTGCCWPFRPTWAWTCSGSSASAWSSRAACRLHPLRNPSCSSSRRAAPSSPRISFLGSRLHHPRFLPSPPKGTARQYLLLCTGFVSIGVLLQHVHYTVNVLAAFLGTFELSGGVWVQPYLGLAHPAGCLILAGVFSLPAAATTNPNHHRPSLKPCFRRIKRSPLWKMVSRKIVF